MVYIQFLYLLSIILMLLIVRAEHPNAKLNTPELIKKYGYYWESHTIETQDGYLLNVYRITGSPKNPPKHGKPVVLLQHGFLCSSDDFVASGLNQSLAYIMSNQNYDVWLGNTRGNRYSREHVNLYTASSEYWNFSWHESGMYDLPATIDYILRKTDAEKLFYVGHSQGTTIFLVMLSEKPEYNDKISKAVLLAPVANMTHTQSSTLQFIKKFPVWFIISIFNTWTKGLTGNVFLTYNGIPAEAMRDFFCNKNIPLIHKLCDKFLKDILGSDDTLFDGENTSNIIGHIPAGFSLQQLLHFIQVNQAERFQKYDYGSKENMKIYKAPIPDLYNLDNVKVPLAIFHSKEDRVGDWKDVETLRQQLKSCEYVQLIREKFNHAAFVYSSRAPHLIYKRLMEYFLPSNESRETEASIPTFIEGLDSIRGFIVYILEVIEIIISSDKE